MTNPQQNALAEALEAAHYYIDASDQELADAGITRWDALDRARDLRGSTQALASNNPAAVEGQGEVTEAMWGGLARDIMMWLDFGPGERTPRALFKHLERCGRDIPQWLRDEPEMNALDHTPSKGTRCVLIYRAMREAALAPAPGQWQDPYRSERTDAVLTRLASQDTELARESIEVISLLRHEQDRLRDENLTLGARVLELEDADREGV